MADDPRDAEIAQLRSQVAYLAGMLAKAINPPEEQWITLPSGQCVPASFISTTPQGREAMGFRWDGNVPVFPSSWLKMAEDEELSGALAE